MSFTRKKPAGWVTNDPITPTHINGIDADLANAFDKVGGETITGDSAWEGQLDMDQSGDGGSVKWRVGNLGDSDATIDCAYDEYIFTAQITVARSFTLRSTTSPIPERGTRLRVSSDDATWLDMARFFREGAVEIARIVTTAGGQGHVDFTFDGSNWRVTGTGGDGEYI